MSTWFISISLVAVCFVIAHVVARHLTEYRRCKVGQGREVMPTYMRDDRNKKGAHRQKWNDRVRRAEEKILDHFEGDARSVSASDLATELGELPVVMEAALEHMRQEIPCVVRMTRSGELLHDFRAHHLQKLRSSRRRHRLSEWSLRAMAILANISAIWPVIVVTMLAAVAFYTFLNTPLDEFENAFSYAFVGVFVVGAGIVGAWLLSAIMKFFARPFGLSVPLDYAHTPSRTENSIPGGDFISSYLYTPKSSSSRSASSRDAGRGGGGGGMGGGPYIIFAAVYLILATVCLFTVYVWVRGMVRAFTNRDDPAEEYGPAKWIRHLVVLDWFERFIPTNDLISRMIRALRRTLFQRRPSDLQLLGRMLRNSPMEGHQLSALDMALAEALDPAEVAEVGAELCRRTDGKAHLTDEGELIFEFDGETLKKTYFPEGPTYEFLERNGSTPNELRRRIEFPGMKLPINMVGLKYAHLKASNFLVGGSILMFLTTVFVLTAVDATTFEGVLPASIFASAELLWSSPAVFIVGALTWMTALGTVCLAVMTRYLVSASVVEGVQRDARRVFAHALRDAVNQRESTVNMNQWIRQLELVFEKVDSRFDAEFFREECVGILIDFDLHEEVDIDESGALEPIDIGPLRQRIQGIRHAMSPGFGKWDEEEEDDDDVLFESLVEHDEIRAL